MISQTYVTASLLTELLVSSYLLKVLDAMRRDAELDEHHGGLAALRVDGGAAANDLLMQLQADILQVGHTATHAQTECRHSFARADGRGICALNILQAGHVRVGW